MKLVEFFEEFEKIASHYQWDMIGPNHCLRGIAEGAEFLLMCPITALCFEKTLRAFPNIKFAKAAQLLGLETQDVVTIMAAADYDYDLSSTVESRQRLLAACGLSEKQKGE